MVQTCKSDAECGADQICFPEGCADPGSGIVIEITGSNSSGIYEQDQVVAAGSLGPIQDLQINGGLSLIGELLQEKSAVVDPTNRLAYAEPVQVLAVGRSDAIPGLSRTYQASLSGTDHGVFSMPIGSGTYRVSAQPMSSLVPPLAIAGVAAAPNKPASVQFVFPSVAGTVVVSGRLLKAKTVMAETPLEIAMDLQAFDPVTGDALSQRSPVSSGPGGKGDFIVSMAPRAATLGSVLLTASPRDSSAAVPTKTFTLQTPLPGVVTLETGDFGAPQTLTGQVVDAANAPIVKASVVADAVVTGGARFRSKVVKTDEKGLFSLEVLPNAPSQPLVLTVVPPALHHASFTQVQLSVSAKTPTEPAAIICQDRVVLSAALTRPDGSVAPGVRVHLTEQSQTARALPYDDADVVTDENGAYAVPLDTGSWRLDFLPGEDLPRFSRVVTVKPFSDTNGDPMRTLALGTFSLPKGRRVTGSVTNVGGEQVQVMPSASLRFFRVTQLEGTPTSVLIDSAIADDKGRYSVTLPTR
jgi:hypothetical protein